MKIRINSEEIKKRSNNYDLGEYVRRLTDNDMDNKDIVTQIMDEWYTAMRKNGISVQPKASTILGTILAKHMTQTRDIWAEALTIKGGDFEQWYSSLSNDEKLQYEEGRKNASRNNDPRELLKG